MYSYGPPTYGWAKAGRPARTYTQQLCEDTECSPEDLPEAMNDREKWRERVRDICASGTTCCCWWWFDCEVYFVHWSYLDVFPFQVWMRVANLKSWKYHLLFVSSVTFWQLTNCILYMVEIIVYLIETWLFLYFSCMNLIMVGFRCYWMAFCIEYICQGRFL